MRLTMGLRPGLRSGGVPTAPLIGAGASAAPRGSVRGVASLAITAMVLGLLLLTVQLWHTRGGSQAVLDAASEGGTTALSALKGSPQALGQASPQAATQGATGANATASPTEGEGVVDSTVAATAAAAAAVKEMSQPGSGLSAEPQGGGGAVAGSTGADAVMYRGAPWRSEVGRWMLSCDATAGAHVIKHVPKVRPFELACPEGCNYPQGVCNKERGECRCRHGYEGPGCGTTRDYACNLPGTEEVPFGPWIVSLCAAHCNPRTARCTCGPGSKYPDRPAVEPCGFAIDPSEPGARKRSDKELLYSTDPASPGWCNADVGGPSPRQNCYCNYDGSTGQHCSTIVEAYCINQCSGHGTCHMGYCQCDNGWFGIDCSTPSVDVPLEANPPPWLLAPSDGSAAPGAGNGAQPGSVGEWQALAQVPRQRPFVYVYDMPPEFTFEHIEGRKWLTYCALRHYEMDNSTKWNSGWLYGSESAVVEAMLNSPHRVADPELADFFFVPVLGACIQIRADDSPGFLMNGKYLHRRPNLVFDYYQRAYEHIRDKYPFWNRHEGKDHIWMFSWDEGTCYAPAALRNSILLSHWGNTESHHKGSTTAYLADSWDALPRDLRGPHPCFNPANDILMPPWKNPSSYWNPAERPSKNINDRPVLFYFNGNLGSAHGGRPEDRYSMGIRQKVAALFASEPNNSGSLGTKTQEGVIVASRRHVTYGKDLSTAKFCGVFPGDGFSARMEDSVLHGCIPVIIQDGIQMEYENFLDYDAFAVRIAEKDMPDMINILKAIPEARVQSMLEKVDSLWQRFSYTSVMRTEARRQEAKGLHPRWAEDIKGLDGDDAIDTLFQILNYKLHTRSFFNREEEKCAAP